MTFQIAIKGIETEAVVKTAERYIRGEIEGDTFRFSPSTAEFAIQARRQESKDRYARQPKIEHHEEEAPRVSAEKVLAWRDAVSGKRTIDSVLDEFGLSHLKASGE